MVVPRFDLAVSGPQLLAVLRRIFGGRSAGQPSTLRQFEEHFAAWLDEMPGQPRPAVSSCLFVPSARSGLYLIIDGLRRLGRITAGRPLVIVPSWTHASVPAVLRAAGLIPWFVDCNPQTLNADAQSVPAAVWAHASAAVVTHLYGTPADIGEWTRRAAQHDVALIEDCAQSLGARFSADGPRTGTVGDAAYFSFQLTKNFTTLGGGMVSTRHTELASLLRAGVSERPSQADGALIKAAVMGLGFRLATRPTVFAATLYPALRAGWKLTGRDVLHDAFEEKITFSAPRGEIRAPAGVQADLGRAQLPLLDTANARRTDIGMRLRSLLGGTPQLTLPDWPAGSRPIFMSFVLRLPERWDFMRELLRLGVDSSPGYLRACHRLPAGGVEGLHSPVPQAECPEALRLEHEQVHLPVYPRLNDREVEFIARAAHAAAERVRSRRAPQAEPMMIGGGHW